MRVIGLTGGIGSGKSTVSKTWQDAGVGIVDADKIAHQVLSEGSPALEEVASEWPEVVKNGALDRKALGRIIFNDPEAKKKLEAITHPAVRQLVEHRTGQLSGIFDVVAYDCPLLIETKLHKCYNPVVVVYCPEMVQVERIMKRDECSEDDALIRVAAQYPLAEKVRHADYVINSDCSLDEFKQRALDTLAKIKEDYGTTSLPPR